jgi:UPF0755 protein
MRRLLGLLLVLVVLAGAGLGLVRFAATRPGPLRQAADIVVPHGHLSDVVRTLQQDRVLERGPAVRLLFVGLARLTGHAAPLHAGELHFPAAVSIDGALQILRHAKPVQHDLTIPEGLTTAQIAELIDAAPILQGGFDLPAEGAILPETYAFERGATRSALIARMQAAMRRTLDAVWASRDPRIPLTDPAQLLVLASIVERETALGPERPLVAEVFLNRLRAGMRLQSDPTVAYGASGGLGALPRPLTRADLAQPNPYNTYVIPGLPPGPIAAPGLAALTAVAHPAQGTLLYFVANGTGGHAFATTLQGHLANVAQFRAIEASHPGQTPTLDPLRPPPQVSGPSR